MRSPSLLAAILLLLCLVVFALLRGETDVGRAGQLAGRTGGESAAPSFVGRRACAGCHELQDELWHGSHHDLAMQVADDETVLGDFDDASFTHFGVTSSFRRRDGSFVVRTDGPDGGLADFELAYTFGAYPLQQYLVEFPGGRFQALSLAWDSRPEAQGGQRWFHLYPNEPIPAGDELHWSGPNQNWNYMCAECHSTNLRRGYDARSDSYDTTWSEIDVSCEACHGPGSNHVEWARALERGEERDVGPLLGLVQRLKDDDGGRWVIDTETGNATRTPPRRSRAEIETCAPCHSRRAAIADAHAAGEPFLDAYRLSLLEQRLYHAGGQILEEVYVHGSFLQSKMFREGVSCGDCHEPHGLRPRFQGNSLCSQCHYEPKYDSPEHHHHVPDSPGAQCVECHMPARTYMVVDPRRDHSLRVPRPDLSVELGTPNACSGCHTDRDARWAAQAVEAWYPDTDRPPHFARALHAGRSGAPGAEAALVARITDPEEAAIVRATALSLLPVPLGTDALGAVVGALADPDGLVRTVAVGGLEGLPPATRLPLLFPLLADPIRTVRIEAARVLADVPAQQLGGEGADLLASALEQYRDAQLVNAERPESHLNLGNLAAARRRFDEAEREYRSALRIDPSFLQAHVNLADLYRALGREDEAERTLRAALEIEPEDGHVHHSLGLLLVRRGDLRAAAESLALAATVRPEIARFSYVYGVCLNELGEADLALAVLEQAHRRHPGDRDLLSALATTHRDAGSIDAALRYAEQLDTLAPGDPSVRGLLEELRAASGR